MSTSKAAKLVAECEKHYVLKVELHGDTLLIIPQGDMSGFQPTFYESEFARINKMLGTGEFKNAIIDLSRSQYFCSAMIGAFMTLKKSIADEGQFVIAEPSTEMLTILKSMHFDDVIPIYNTVPQAIKNVSNETIWERVRPKPVVLNSLLGFCLLLAAAVVLLRTNWLSPFIGTQEAAEYNVNLEILEEMNAERRAGTFDQNWEKIRSTLDDRLHRHVKSFNRIQSGTLSKDAVHEATVCLWQLHDERSAPDDERLQRVVNYMHNAAKTIREKQRIELEVPKQEGYVPALKTPLEKPSVSLTEPPAQHSTAEVNAAEHPAPIVDK